MVKTPKRGDERRIPDSAGARGRNMKIISPIPHMSFRKLAAGAAIVTAAVSAAAAAPSDAQAPLAHVVPTNFPGVFAFTQPPAGFDPLAASPEELATWGYPLRPGVEEGPEALARWSQEVSTSLRRFQRR
jgi:hypothetical protein